MICRTFKYANTLRSRNLLFASAAIHLVIFVSGCLRFDQRSPQSDGKHAWSVELRENEHKSAQHPEKKYYAGISPLGLEVSFHTALGHFGTYTFPHQAFTLGEPAFLSCPGSPDLLPMRVVLVKGSKDLNDYHDYKIEWLDKPPATAGGTRVVRSH